MILKAEKLFLVAVITAMSEKFLMIIFVLFMLFICICMAVDTFTFKALVSGCSNTPSVSALGATHTKILYADSSGYASSFIPEFLR